MNLFKTLACRGAALAIAIGLAVPAAAQQDLDRNDPGVAAKELAAQSHPTSLAAPARVNTEAAPSAWLGENVPVGAIVVEGAQTFQSAQFAPIIAPYVGRSLSRADLKALVQAIANVAGSRGYVFATAYVPQQTLANGVLRVRIDEGRIDEVRVSGSQDAGVRRMLSALADGTPVTRGKLERALLLAGDLPGVRIAGSRYQREGGRGVLIVDAAVTGVRGSVQIDNWGSGAVGPIRARIRTDINSAWLKGDQLSVHGTLTPLQPRELATIGFDYAADTGLHGLSAGIGASYTRVQPGDRPSADQIDGRSVSVNANLSYPIVRTLDANLWAAADFTVRDVKQDQAAALIRKDRFSTLTLGLTGSRRSLGGWLYARVGVRQGLDVLGATRRGDVLSSRIGGSALFTKAEAYADWVGPLAGPLSLKIAAEGQIASRKLLSSEEMGIGGPRFGRAYDYSERSGDRDIAGLAELRFDIKHSPITGRTTQLYVFGDAGTVGSFNGGSRGGSLYSAGGGVRFDLSRVFDAGAEIAFPIRHDRYETGNRKPRLSFTLSARF